jgi:CubicO group peptidase (beta-lactamase class C family)
MKKITSLLMLAVVLVTACKSSPTPTPVPADTAADAAPFDAVRAHIKRLVAEGEVPSMAVAVARDGKIVWEEGFGLADREKNIPATEHTPYPLASISKSLMATGLMVLVERGLIDLDSPISATPPLTRCSARVQRLVRRRNGNAREVAMASAGSSVSVKTACVRCGIAAGPLV